ncbi:DUF523 domain-containing protein [Clostridium beijerinckii]|uniref:DUF523 domain-containing protein n=1 Tax=Clostridium beijerinckii TaxID=1520 RepID=UPI001F379DD9|nr:DUF523 domain-containing protein [Clostridium beijerinckii]
MEKVLKKKLKVGISECCFGAKVRYNGKGFDYVKNFGRENEQFVFYPMCPECLAGLGVPRIPISIKGGSGQDVLEGKAKVKNKTGEELTENLIKACNFCLELLKSEDIYIYMYKEGSPSCGVYRTTLKDKRLGNPPGVLGAMLLKEGFFLVCADDLESPIKRWDIRRRLNAFVWAREVEIENKNQLYNVWHALKFLCQELDEKAARSLGNKLSNLNDTQKEDIEEYRQMILDIIRKPSTLSRIKAWLWKNYSYYRKYKGIELDIVKEPTDLRSNTILAEELIKLENKLYNEGYSLGSSPILYRGKR